MPPRGPLNLARADAERLLKLLQNADDEQWKNVLEKLRLGLAAPAAQASEDFVTVVIKEEEADGFLDLLEPSDSIRPMVQHCLEKMRGH